jgi:hypothetical protein
LGPGRRRRGSPLGWAPWPRLEGSPPGLPVRPCRWGERPPRCSQAKYPSSPGAESWGTTEMESAGVDTWKRAATGTRWPAAGCAPPTRIRLHSLAADRLRTGTIHRDAVLRGQWDTASYQPAGLHHVCARSGAAGRTAPGRLRRDRGSRIAGGTHRVAQADSRHRIKPTGACQRKDSAMEWNLTTTDGRPDATGGSGVCFRPSHWPADSCFGVRP